VVHPLVDLFCVPIKTHETIALRCQLIFNVQHISKQVKESFSCDRKKKLVAMTGYDKHGTHEQHAPKIYLK